MSCSSQAHRGFYWVEHAFLVKLLCLTYFFLKIIITALSAKGNDNC